MTKQRMTIGDLVDSKGNVYLALGESNEAKNSVIVMRTKQKLDPPYQEQGSDLRAADLNQDEGMNTSSSAPLSADSIREAVHMKMLAKSDSAKDLGELTVIPLGFAVSIAVELITGERQRIADSLPEKFPEIGVTQNQIDWARGYNEAIEAVRAVLIPPTPGDLENPVESAS